MFSGFGNPLPIRAVRDFFAPNRFQFLFQGFLAAGGLTEFNLARSHCTGAACHGKAPSGISLPITATATGSSSLSVLRWSRWIASRRILKTAACDAPPVLAPQGCPGKRSDVASVLLHFPRWLLDLVQARTAHDSRFRARTLVDTWKQSSGTTSLKHHPVFGCRSPNRFARQDNHWICNFPGRRTRPPRSRFTACFARHLPA